MKDLEYRILKAGFCMHPEFITIKGGKLSACAFPALFALIKHSEKGYILFDTGYADHFFSSTRNWIYKIYSLVTPVNLQKQESAKEQLENLGIDQSEISYIFLSHFHADHIAGIRDFKNAKFITKKEAFDDIDQKKGFDALLKGFLPELLPEDFSSRLVFIEDSPVLDLEEEMYPFSEAYDIFSDNSMLAIDLPGHAKGQIGLYLPAKKTFFVADAAWSLKAIKECLLPSTIVRFIFDSFRTYSSTLRKLNALYHSNKEIKIIASHCDSHFKKENDA